jgi:hypothetical protein
MNKPTKTFFYKTTTKNMPHKRGGFYTFRNMKDVTSWGGILLDRECLNHLRIGDVVRIFCEHPIEESTYVEITDVLPDGHFKGKINTTYRGTYCNICKEEGTPKNYLVSCGGYRDNNCNSHFHPTCLEKQPDAKCCDCVLERFPLQQDEVVIFKKTNIGEIPNWTKNTEKLGEIYGNKENRGYAITGWR